MTVRILGIDCSPRKNSNSGALLAKSFETANAALKGDIEYEVLHLRDCEIAHCLACGEGYKGRSPGLEERAPAASWLLW